MKTNLNYINITFLILVLSTSLLGCSEVKSTGLMVSETAQLIPSTATKTITPTPTEETSVTPTIKPSLTLSPTIIPSFTPLPTLSRSEAKQKIYNLVRDNGGCDLPCWWGITPGITPWNEAYQYLSALITDTEVTETVCLNENEMSGCFFSLYLKYDLSESLKGGGHIGVKDQQIISIFIGPGTTKQIFQIHQILNNYGKPDKVFIQTHSSTFNNRRNFVFVLLYSSKYFMATYSFNAKDYGGIIYGCPRGISPQVTMWDSDRIVSDEEIEQWTIGTEPSVTLQPLDEVSDMDIETFYQAFIDPNKLNCIQIPISVWEKLESHQ